MLKKIMLAIMFVLISAPAFASEYREHYDDVHVNGYTKSDGTQVDSYYRRCEGCHENG